MVKVLFSHLTIIGKNQRLERNMIANIEIKNLQLNLQNPEDEFLFLDPEH